MNKYRNTALCVTAIFSTIFLLDASGDLRALRNAAPLDMAILIAGPVSVVITTAIGWFYPRLAGWWLVLGGSLTTLLFAGRTARRMAQAPAENIATLLIVLAVFAVPMFVAGGLLLKYAALRHPKFSNLTPFTR